MKHLKYPRQHHRQRLVLVGLGTTLRWLSTLLVVLAFTGAYAFLLPVVFRRGICISTIPKTSTTGKRTSTEHFDGSHLRWHRRSPRSNIGPIYQTSINDIDDNQNGNMNTSTNKNRYRNINGTNINQNDTHVCINGRSLLSPNHLLYSEAFRKFEAPLNLSVPLSDALRLIKKSLEVFFFTRL